MSESHPFHLTDTDELVKFQGVLVHRTIVNDLEVLYEKSVQSGFKLNVVSGFRSVERQLKIWNDKATGVRPLLNETGATIDPGQLSERELVFSILRWSALPGASRHHWGTDIDVIDRAAVSAQYKVQLTLAETQGDGPFAAFHQWLSGELNREGCPFFRPYTRPLGGVAPEPWHLSYSPTAAACQRALDREQLRQWIAETDIAMQTVILAHFDEIFDRFVWVPWLQYPQS